MNVVCVYNSLFNVSHLCRSMLARKNRMFEGVPNARPGVDVIFIDCPENLSMPGLSKPPHKVPKWNANPDDEALQLEYSFAAEHLQDDRCIILFYSYSIKSKKTLLGCMRHRIW